MKIGMAPRPDLWHHFTMTQVQKTSIPAPSFDEAVFPAVEDADEKVKAWQAAKIKAGIADADAGRFVTVDEFQAIVKKYIPNG